MGRKTKTFSFPLIPALVGLIITVVAVVCILSFGKLDKKEVKNLSVEETIQTVETGINKYAENMLDVKTIGRLKKDGLIQKVTIEDKYVYALKKLEQVSLVVKFGKGEVPNKVNEVTDLKDVFLIDSAFDVSYVDKDGKLYGTIEYVTDNPILDEKMYMFNQETGAITGLKEDIGYYFVENKGYFTKSVSLIIPAQINGIPVKSVSLNTKIDKEGNAVKDEKFIGYRNLEKVVINEGIEIIDEDAFIKCVALEEVTIPETVKTIKRNAFYGCSSYANIKLPSQIEKVGKSAFEYTSVFNKVEKGDVYIGDVYYKYKGNLLEKSMTIKDGTRVIADGALENQSLVETIKLPESLEYIGEYSFSGCLNVSDLNIPDNLKVIYSSSINGCSGLGNLMVNPNTQIR